MANGRVVGGQQDERGSTEGGTVGGYLYLHNASPGRLGWVGVLLGVLGIRAGVTFTRKEKRERSEG